MLKIISEKEFLERTNALIKEHSPIVFLLEFQTEMQPEGDMRTTGDGLVEEHNNVIFANLWWLRKHAYYKATGEPLTYLLEDGVPWFMRTAMFNRIFGNGYGYDPMDYI